MSNVNEGYFRFKTEKAGGCWIAHSVKALLADQIQPMLGWGTIGLAPNNIWEGSSQRGWQCPLLERTLLALQGTCDLLSVHTYDWVSSAMASPSLWLRCEEKQLVGTTRNKPDSLSLPWAGSRGVHMTTLVQSVKIGHSKYWLDWIEMPIIIFFILLKLKKTLL